MRCLGPVRLVLREVISRLIASSFKSGAVLKKLEVGDTRRPDFWVETMKVSCISGLILDSGVSLASKESDPGILA